MPSVLALLAALVVIPILLRLAARAIGRAAVERQPDRIHLTCRDARAWRNPQNADTLSRALTWKGFEDAGTFAIDEMPNVVVQLLADPKRSMTATIYEHPMA